MTWTLDEIKTKSIQAFLDAVSAGKAMFITPEVNVNVYKSARNIPGVLHHHRQDSQRL